MMAAVLPRKTCNRDAQKIAYECASHCDFRTRKRFNQRFLKRMHGKNEILGLVF